MGSHDIQIVPVNYALDIISPGLEHAYNLAFSYGIFSVRIQILKVAVCSRGETKNLSNYGQTSILPIFSKGLERVVKEKKWNWFVKSTAYNTFTFDFRKRLWSELTLLTQNDIFLGSIEKQFLPFGIFIDFSKAFDRINH